MKRLIVNADGYGFTYGINRAVEETVEAGMVTSVSVNVNFEPIQQLPDFLKRYPHVSVGVHLNPLVGRPVSSANEVPSLVNNKGEFLNGEFVSRLQSGRIHLDELELEMTRQIEVGRQLAGASLTHLDSHQNCHLYPRFFKLFLRLVKKFNIQRMRTHKRHMCVENQHRTYSAARYYVTKPLRILTHTFSRYEMWSARRVGIRMADRLLCFGNLEKANDVLLKSWLNIFKNVPPGTNEIFCHPAYVDADLRRYATYVDSREKEVAALTNGILKDALPQSGVQLISFHDI